MPAKVNIEAAGDHCFDLPHLRRSGAGDLIQLLLEKSGYYEDIVWRVRVNEKQRCSGMTPPISVIRHKEWGVFLRIKPGDNNTCHNVTLLIPSGFKTVEVYNKLKTVEKSFNRNWRKSAVPVSANFREANGVLVSEVDEVCETSAGDIIDSTVGESLDHDVVESTTGNELLDHDVAESVDRFDVQTFLKNIDNIKSICSNIRSMEKTVWKDNTQFMSALCVSLNITLRGHQGGAMMRSMMNRGLVKKTLDGGRHIGYSLSRKGRSLVKKEPRPRPAAKSSKVGEWSKLICEIGPLAQDISHASVRLKEIQSERLDCQKKIESLDKEEQELGELFDNAEIEKFLLQLVDIKLK